VRKCVFGAVEAGFFCWQGVFQAIAAGGFEGDFGARLNELISARGCLRLKRQGYHLLNLEKADGVVHFGFVRSLRSIWSSLS
jgi:hypothetical protein